MSDLLTDLGVRCFHCGNVGSKRRPLRWEGERGASIVIHAWVPCDKARADAPYDDEAVYDDDGIPLCGHRACSDIWPCPHPPDGWGVCIRCREGGPIAGDRPKYGEVAAAVIERDGQDETTMRYGSTVLPVFVHANRCPKQARERARPKKEVSARQIEVDEEAQASADLSRADAIPSDGGGRSVAELASLWGVSDRTAQRIVARLLMVDAIRWEEVPTRAGGAPRKVYWRVDP